MTELKGSIGWTGEGDDQLSPGQFLQEIDNKIDKRNFISENRKVNCMRNNIAYGSPTDDWFRRLTIDEKDTYEHLTEAFKKAPCRDSEGVKGGAHSHPEGMGVETGGARKEGG
jgi:hypothetical protein